jgi:hypothetical protein
MRRHLAIFIFGLLVLSQWGLYAEENSIADNTFIKGSFFHLYYNRDRTGPEQAEQVSQWLEEAWRYYLKKGYRKPPAESWRIEVFLQGSFLLTNYVQLDTIPPQIYLAADFGRYPERKKLERTLIAHEIFHIFQSVYCWPAKHIRQESAWLFEGTALTAAAEFADHPHIFKTYSYQSSLPLWANSYGASRFWQYLTEHYPTLTLKEIWETLHEGQCAESREILASIEKTIRNHTGKSFDTHVREFLDYYSYSLTRRSPKP